jgi:SsrA-binding protein
MMNIQKHIQIQNKRASFEYFFLDTYTAGIVLTGTEIKSIRLGKANLSDAYCYVQSGEIFIKHLHIAKYDAGTYLNHDPLRERKLLLQRKEIKKIANKLQDQGLTLIPVKLFISDKGLAKVVIALAKGKKLYDKRESIKAKDVARDTDRKS